MKPIYILNFEDIFMWKIVQNKRELDWKIRSGADKKTHS